MNRWVKKIYWINIFFFQIFFITIFCHVQKYSQNATFDRQVKSLRLVLDYNHGKIRINTMAYFQSKNNYFALSSSFGEIVAEYTEPLWYYISRIHVLKTYIYIWDLIFLKVLQVKYNFMDNIAPQAIGETIFLASHAEIINNVLESQKQYTTVNKINYLNTTLFCNGLKLLTLSHYRGLWYFNPSRYK